MKKLVFLLNSIIFIGTFFSCSDSEKDNYKEVIYKCSSDFQKNTKLIISNTNYNTIDSVTFDKAYNVDSYLTLQIKNNKDTIYVLSMYDLDLEFKNDNKLTNITFSFDNKYKLLDFSSNTFKSGFFSEKYSISNNNFKEINMQFSGEKPINLYGVSTDKGLTNIQGNIIISKIELKQ